MAVIHSHLPLLRPGGAQPHVSLHRQACTCLWWWSLPPLPLRQLGLHQPPETHFTSGFPEVTGLNTAAGCDSLSIDSYRQVKGTKWIFPSNMEAPAWAPVCLWCPLGPTPKWSPALETIFGNFPPLPPLLSLSPLSILDFEPPYDLFLSAWLHHSWQVRLAWIEGNTNSTSHSMPAAGRTCSQQRLQTPVKSNKDLHHWMGMNYNCDYSCWNRGHCVSCFRSKSECRGVSQKEVSFVHSTEHQARAAQQGSTAGCSKEEIPRVFFPLLLWLSTDIAYMWREEGRTTHCRMGP